MITWRGTVTAMPQRQRGWRLNTVEVRASFVVYDDAAPAVPLHTTSEVWLWPLSELEGMPPGQMANMILNTGLEIPAPPPAPPGTPPIVYPPPLKDRGAAVLQDFTQAGRSLDVPLPRDFGP